MRSTRPVLVPPPETENTLDKYLDFVPNRINSVNVNSMSPLNVGNLPNVLTRDHVVSSIIKNWAKIFLLRGVQSHRHTPKKNMPSSNECWMQVY